VFTARYALSPYIKQRRFVFKGLMCAIGPSLCLSVCMLPGISCEIVMFMEFVIELL
jgi:hypothetical protein